MARKNKKKPTAEEKQRRRRRRIRRWLVNPFRVCLLASLGVGVGVGGYLLFRFLRTSPALSVRSIEVKGAQRTKVKEILEAGKLSEGMNIFAIEMKATEERLCELPWVRSAEIRRIVPDRIFIQLEEHTPVALAVLQNLYYINEKGEVFKRLQPGEPVDLPLLSGFTREQFQKQPERVKVGLVNSLDLLEALRACPCLRDHQVAEIRYDELMGFAVVLDPGAVSVHLGEHAQDQLASLCQLMDRLKERNLRARVVLLDQYSRPGWATVKLD